MRLLRILTAGESHGPALVGIIEGMAAGLALEASFINAQLARRQMGHGRSARMRIEHDEVEILSGVRRGRTSGSPIALRIANRDCRDSKSVTVPRPGHADLAGALKYGHKDLRDVIERASARETAVRTALAGVARRFLEEFGVSIGSRVISIGGESDPTDAGAIPVSEINPRADSSPVRCLQTKASRRMVAAIEAARKEGDTLGGVFEVLVSGLPAGLGSYVQWDRRLEGDLAKAFMSLNAVKGVEIGLGFEASRRRGSAVHDALFWSKDKTRVLRRTNRSGGVDGGVTTGETLVVRAGMKPLATLMRPLASVDLKTRLEAPAAIERSDVCAVPAAAVIGEALAALEVADAFLRKYGGDSMEEIQARHALSRSV